MSKDRPLMDYSDAELEQALVVKGQNVVFSYNDVRVEIERRFQKRHADRSYWLSILAVVVSVAALTCSVLVAVLK
jgi:hypothetical protein